MLTPIIGHGIEVVDKILNRGPAGGGVEHTVNSMIRIYCRDEILDVRRAALQTASRWVTSL